MDLLKLVEALLQIHSCFFSHIVKLCGLALSAVAVAGPKRGGHKWYIVPGPGRYWDLGR